MGKFRELQRLLGKAGETNFQKWLEIHWNNFTADFNLGMENLDLESNFKSQRTTISLTEGTDTSISHALGVVPSGHLVLNGVAGVIRGADDWSSGTIYLTLDSDLYSGQTKEVDLLILA